jgi:hypothetical protein
LKLQVESIALSNGEDQTQAIDLINN